MNCKAKHTAMDIPDGEWFCPKCGAGVNEGWHIEEVPEEAREDCERLHEKDFIVCDTCGYETTGRRLIRWYMREKSLVVCPLCKGKGKITKSKAEAYQG